MNEHFFLEDGSGFTGGLDAAGRRADIERMRNARQKKAESLLYTRSQDFIARIVMEDYVDSQP